VITSDPEAKPPFREEAGTLALLPEKALVKAPMELVRTPADPTAPRLRLSLTAAAPIRLSVDSYDGHQRLKASVTAIAPEFAALLLLLPGGAPEPQVRVERQDGAVAMEVRGLGRVDQILWPNRGERRPVLTSSKP
jgi:hypothetical protein